MVPWRRRNASRGKGRLPWGQVTLGRGWVDQGPGSMRAPRGDVGSQVRGRRASTEVGQG